MNGFGDPIMQTDFVAFQGLAAEKFGAYPRSLCERGGRIYFLGRRNGSKYLGVVSPAADNLSEFEGETSRLHVAGREAALVSCALTPGNAAAMRASLPFLVPRTLGLRKSAGCGDRLGLATPGHVRAIRNCPLAPIFAQQSMRENARTGRTPQQVMDDALWGVLQEGWQGGYGADADHLKSASDIDLCVAAGYTFFTFDPGEHVDNGAETASPQALRRMAGALPWAALETTLADLTSRLSGQPIDLGDQSVVITEADLLRAAAKYGQAVAHTAALYRHLVRVARGPFEVEMSVDETETVTTPAEHIYIASELRRLGVRWVSLAPRYVGRFEKGVDYIGDVAAFEESFSRHLAIARRFGPYKLSLHSGSDKFAIYPATARLAGDLVHLKTAGTSYLEALRAVAVLDPSLFREITAFAVERYPADRASYHVSAEASKLPAFSGWKDPELAGLLEDFHARQILHVTFGSVVQTPSLRKRLFDVLKGSEETYYEILRAHFEKHLAPYRQTAVGV
jgi:hypothetical protein